MVVKDGFFEAVSIFVKSSSRKVLIVLLPLAFSANAVAGPSFSICNQGKTRCVQDATAKWVDKLSKVDYATETVKLFPYDGIAIDSSGAFQNITLYVKGYKGVGKYPLTGTDTMVWSKSPNAVYSDDLANAPFWISTQKPGDSYIEITSAKGGLLSGKYKVTTYLDGNASNKPVRLEGEFKDIPQDMNQPDDH